MKNNSLYACTFVSLSKSCICSGEKFIAGIKNSTFNHIPFPFYTAAHKANPTLLIHRMIVMQSQ